MSRRKRNLKRRPVRVRPYLLPACPLEYARGIYQGEGSYTCAVDEKRKEARLIVRAEMGDKDALKPLEPCFGTEVVYRPKTKMYTLARGGRAARDIAEALAVTPTRKRQIQEAHEKCRKKWEQGYTDYVET